MLKFQDVRKKYSRSGGIERVNIGIEPQKFYLFLGENGSGKSTTLKLISKVIFPDKNQGTLLNEFKEIIYLPDKRSYPNLLSAKVYLAYYLSLKMKSKRIEEYLERYQLPNGKIGSFSKGMQQKLGIVQTILKDGDLYLFDEPTDGLDKESITLFKEDIEHLLKQKKTVIISTHNKNIFKDLKPICYTFKNGVCNEKKI